MKSRGCFKTHNLHQKSDGFSTHHQHPDLDLIRIILAENEDVMLKLAFDFKKINRRINGLKNLIIPQLQIQIKKIKDKLEEYEREQFVRLKSTKNVIKKKSVRS